METATRKISVGDIVFTETGTYRWAGEGDDPAFERIIFSVGRYLAEIQTSYDRIAPVSMESSINLKDPRIIARRNKEGRPVTWVGEWECFLEGEQDKALWVRTKREGVMALASRLAIRDWHAANDK